MPQQVSPFLESKWGWNFGESGWNSGNDENILKFSFMFDGNVDGVVAMLPPATNGSAYFLTTDNRLYFAIGLIYYSSPCPNNFIFKIKSTGDFYQFNGADATLISNPLQLDARLDAVELSISSLGTAAFQDIEAFATQDALDIVSSQNSAYTDALRNDLALATGSDLVGWRGITLEESNDLLSSSSKVSYRGGQLHGLKSDLENRLCQKTEIVFAGDSITWGMTVTGMAATEPRTGKLTDPRNNLTSPSWVNLVHKWIGNQFFRLTSPTSTSTATATYTKTVDLFPSEPNFNISPLGGAGDVIGQNAGATLGFFIDYMNPSTFIEWDMFGEEFVYVYAQLSNGASYELFVDNVSQGTFTTSGSPVFNVTRTHTFPLGSHKVKIVKLGDNTSTLRTEAVRINKTVVIKNQGIIGSDTKDWLSTGTLLASAVTTSTRYLFLMLGTNDRSQTDQVTSESAITENLFKILSWLGGNRPLLIPIMLCANEANQGVDATYHYDMHSVRSAVSHVSRFRNLDFVDYYEVTRDSLSDNLSYLADDLHPNDFGHYIMSKVLIDAINMAGSGNGGVGVNISNRLSYDVNDDTLSGRYYAGTTTSNKPLAATGTIDSMPHGDGRVVQIYYPYDIGVKPVVRVRTAAGVWTNNSLAYVTESLQLSGGTMTGTIQLVQFTLSTLPNAATRTGSMIWVTDLAGGAFFCYSDGLNWKRLDTKAVAS